MRYELGDRVLLCNRYEGTISHVFEYLGRVSYHVELDADKYGVKDTAIAVLDEDLTMVKVRLKKPAAGKGRLKKSA